MDCIEELIANQSLKCSKCGKEIMDEWEYHDNNGVCDDCYTRDLLPSSHLTTLLFHAVSSAIPTIKPRGIVHSA